MGYPAHLRFCSTGLLTSLLGGMLLVSCSPSFAPSSSPAPEAAIGGEADTVASSDAAGSNTLDGIASEVPRSQPQLVKTAELVVTVQSVTEGIETVKQVAQQMQGDVLRLQDNTPTDDRIHHMASVQIRVPQSKLEAALQALKALGSIQQQSITAEDVADQLVDYQARLRNLRKTEATLLEIMGRSGEVGDVLKVAQELSTVRNSIEQVSAQLATLENRVAYSTINLNLQEAVAGNLPQRSTEIQLQETWGSATRSIGKLTVDLLQLGIWLLVYSPYWLLLVGIAYLVHSRLRGRSLPASSPDTEPPAST